MAINYVTACVKRNRALNVEQYDGIIRALLSYEVAWGRDYLTSEHWAYLAENYTMPAERQALPPERPQLSGFLLGKGRN